MSELQVEEVDVEKGEYNIKRAIDEPTTLFFLQCDIAFSQPVHTGQAIADSRFIASVLQDVSRYDSPSLSPSPVPSYASWRVGCLNVCVRVCVWVGRLVSLHEGV